MLSFIIPTLNEEKTIEKTLKSISAYSGEKEIIISDGKSTDRTVEVVRKYADKIIVHDGLTRQNIAKGRNAGAKEARGEYIVFVDADVTVPDIDNFIKKIEVYYKEDPKLVAVTAGCLVYKETARMFDNIIFQSLALYFSFLNFIGFGAAGGEFQMIKREAFNKVGGFDERLAISEDMDLFWRLTKIGRTRLPVGLNIYHTGRRPHKVGWPRLLWTWTRNTITAFFFKRSDSGYDLVR
jgi:glycosyltransferase involved in cell wall biosynthesis